MTHGCDDGRVTCPGHCSSSALARPLAEALVAGHALSTLSLDSALAGCFTPPARLGQGRALTGNQAVRPSCHGLFTSPDGGSKYRRCRLAAWQSTAARATVSFDSQPASSKRGGLETIKSRASGWWARWPSSDTDRSLPFSIRDYTISGPWLSHCHCCCDCTQLPACQRACW